MRPARLLAPVGALALVAAFTCACSSSSGAKPTGCTSGCTEAGTPDSGAAAEGGNDAASEAEGHEAGPSQQYVGGVSLEKLGSVYNLSAVFYAAPDGGTSNACPGTQNGACCYRPPNGTVPTYTYVSAGTLSIDDGPLPVSSVMPGTKDIYSDTSANGGSLSWKAGDMVTAAASGDVVSAFSTQTVAPDDITSTTPDLSQPVTVSTASDFMLAWAAASQSGATMEILLSDDKTYGSIECVVKDSVASVSVPKALLANFASGDTGRVSLTRLEEVAFTSGNVQGSLTVSTVGPGPQAMFQ